MGTEIIERFCIRKISEFMLLNLKNNNNANFKSLWLNTTKTDFSLKLCLVAQTAQQ